MLFEDREWLSGAEINSGNSIQGKKEKKSRQKPTKANEKRKPVAEEGRKSTLTVKFYGKILR